MNEKLEESKAKVCIVKRCVRVIVLIMRSIFDVCYAVGTKIVAAMVISSLTH